MGHRNTKLNIADLRSVRTLGEGSYGKVEWVICGRKDFALKIMEKRRFFRSTDNSRLVWAERNNMIACNDSPFIVSLVRAFQSRHTLYLVTPLYRGGDLMRRFRNQGDMDPSDVIFYLSECILALEVIHSKKICHRDVKPENIFLDEEGHVVLGDLGLSIKIDTEDQHHRSHYWGQCGSYGYRAPEVICDESCSFPADVYALGISFYMLTFGGVLWLKTAERLKKEQATGRTALIFPKGLSELQMKIKDLLIGMLDVNPKTRITLDKMKQHSSFEGVDWNAAAKRELVPPWTPGKVKKKDALRFSQVESGNVDWEDSKFNGFEFNAKQSSVAKTTSSCTPSTLIEKVDETDNSITHSHMKHFLRPPSLHRRLGQVVSTPPTKNRKLPVGADMTATRTVACSFISHQA